ncbi:hypothetical protein [Streptomyces sp. MJP52]|uniref:hypothetical protein n=1 Tax=Streptomyces sp. MJP52 TaxID=2940555 RepID=UPI002476B5F5|nr:hypothetical protein [Streptomyces sp. MJP52]MDH6228325.1 hypothetical protein [Streptomyces sp. MJP52]
MHVVIAWWDKRRAAAVGTGRPHPTATAGLRPEDPVPLTGEFPGLRSGRWITDPGADLQGLALVWDSAVSAELSLPALFERTFGCAPSHRWAFELRDAPPRHEDTENLPAELELLLHA